jgi:hypothetical protein
MFFNKKVEVEEENAHLERRIIFAIARALNLDAVKLAATVVKETQDNEFSTSFAVAFADAVAKAMVKETKKLTRKK